MPVTAQLLVAAVLVATPQVLAWSVFPEMRDLTDAAAVSSLVVYSVVLLATLVYYFYWRMVDDNPTAWLVVGLSGVSLQGLIWSFLLVSQRATGWETGWLLLVDLVTACLLLALAWAVARPVSLTLDPLLVGLASGAHLALARVLLDKLLDPLEPGRLAVLASIALLLVLLGTVVIFLGRLDSSRQVTQSGLFFGAVLLVVGHVLHYGQPLRDVTGLLAIAAGTMGAALLMWSAMTLLRSAIQAQKTTLTALEQRLDAAETQARDGQARLHEIGSTVAGISSASYLMRGRRSVSRERRHQLEQMVSSELARLERLMGARHIGPAHDFGVDEVLEPLVVAHRAQGHPVRWDRSDARALGQPDDLAEVVSILLSNAARHGGAEGTLIYARTAAGGSTEVVVADSGPGISAAMRRRLFDWGTRGPDSPGQGIGLHIAQQLMLHQSGQLELVETTGPGATFLVRLPGPRPPSGQ